MGPTNLSEKVLEHMLSSHVVLERINLKCKECGESFKRPKEYNLHLVTHLSQVVKKNEGRFVKRFQCPDCDQKFVLKNTLEAHAILHAPFPHVCHCGIGFYLKTDLNSHKQLVHAAEMKEEMSKLTFRKAKALKNEFWVPAINYNGPKTEEQKSAPKSRVRPRLKAELVVSSKKSKAIRSAATKRGRGPERTADGRFLCKLCGKSFSQAAAVYVHYKRHTGIKEFVCPHCGKECFDKHALAQHVRTHTGERPFACAHCGRRFGDPSALRRHRRLHTGEKPYACAHCGKRFSDASAKIVHQRRHNREKNFPCDVCHKNFYTFSNLRLHKHVHSDVRNYECEICQKSFKTKQYLDIHQKTHEKKRVRRFECDHCGLKRFTKISLENHIKSKHLPVVKMFKCTECDGEFAREHNRRKHMLYKHNGSNRYECDYCGVTFPIRGEIFRHIIVHHLNIKCPVCSKAFATSRDLEEHKMQSCLRCLECGVTVKTKEHLLRHSQLHENKRNYKCHICFKGFNLKVILKRHINNIHGNGEKYECNDCGTKFSIKKHLANHIFKKHLSYVYCSDCMRNFYSVTDLKKHKSIGCRKEKFTCDMCGMHYRQKHTLANHIMVRHLGIKNYECHHCHKKYGWRSVFIRHIELMHTSKNKKRKRNRS